MGWIVQHPNISALVFYAVFGLALGFFLRRNAKTTYLSEVRKWQKDLHAKRPLDL